MVEIGTKRVVETQFYREVGHRWMMRTIVWSWGLRPTKGWLKNRTHATPWRITEPPARLKALAAGNPGQRLWAHISTSYEARRG